MANRHLSRSIVLQTLFEWDFLLASENKKKDPKEILSKNLKEFAPGLENDSFVFSLLNQIIENKKVIDEIVEKTAPDWPLDKISIIDRNILRIGLAELLFGDKNDVPFKVAINEAIELAKTFGGENSGKFINGVLGTVYKELGEPDKDQKSKKKKKDEPVDISKLPVEKCVGAVVYATNQEDIYLALVHDVFGYWTLSKGRVKEEEEIEQAAKRKVKEEMGIDISIKDKLGENEYVASHPEKGKSLKKVFYFLAQSEYTPLKLGESGGLDEAKWFKLSEVPGLCMYSDIVSIITKAIKIINK
jgi:N utilization substance protein B